MSDREQLHLREIARLTTDVERWKRIASAADENAHRFLEQRDGLRRQMITTREAAAIRWLVKVAEFSGDGEHDDAIASLLDKAQYAEDPPHG